MSSRETLLTPLHSVTRCSVKDELPSGFSIRIGREIGETEGLSFDSKIPKKKRKDEGVGRSMGMVGNLRFLDILQINVG